MRLRAAALAAPLLLLATEIANAQTIGRTGREKTVQLVGFSAAQVMGDVGVFGMTQTCQAEFPLTRLCTDEEVRDTVVIPSGLVGNAWLHSAGDAIIDGNNNCFGWRSAGGTGVQVDSVGGFTEVSCLTPASVACCGFRR